VKSIRPPLPQALKGRNHLFSQILFYNTIDYAPLGLLGDRLPFFVGRCPTLLIVGLSALFQFSINQMDHINPTNQSSDNMTAKGDAMTADGLANKSEESDKSYENQRSDNYPVIARSRQLKANKIHFQFSTFNFQLITDCFATLAMTARGDAMTAKGEAMTARGNAMTARRDAMTADGLANKSEESDKSYENQSSDNNPVIAKSGQLKANKIHFQFSIFNFQLI
jgi:hypothetical protein